MLSVYVYTNGDVANAFFNAIAAFLGTDDWATLLYIGSIFAVLGSAFLYTQTHDLMTFLKFFGVYMAVTCLMLAPKTSVEIIDVSNPMATYQVDNIPVGLALPASVISTIGYGLTQDLSDIFHTVDDVSYTHTGMLFGAKLFYTVTQGSQIQSSELRENMMDFTRQCIIPDITINKKYTVQQLVDTPDILSFLSSESMSPLRGIYMNGQFQTCAAALPIIKTEVQTEATTQQNWIERLLNGDNDPNTAELQTQVGDIYSQMIGMSQDAQSILVQNMMVNALRQGIQNSFAATDSTSAMLNYAETSGLQKQLLSDNTIARTATYLIPLMQTVFFLLCVGVFPIIIVFALQPWLFANMLKNYIFSLVYLNLWSVLFVLLDFIMKTALSHSMTGLAIDQGGITLSNQNALLYEVEQFAGYAGYLMISVPLLAGFIFRGLQNTIASAAITMVGGVQSNLSSTASGLAEGNMSMGNANIGNESWNNMSANKHDLNSTYFAGQSSKQIADGSIITGNTTSHAVLSMSSAISQTPISMHWGNSISASANEQAAYHRSEASSAATNFSESISAGSQALTSLSHSVSNSKGSSDSWNITDSAHVNEAIHHASTVAHDYAERHSISDQEANQVLIQSTIGGSLGVGGQNLGGKVSLEGNAIKNAISTATGDYSDAKNFAQTSGYSHDISLIHDATRSHSYHANSEDAASALNSLSTHLDTAKSASTQWSTQLTEAQNFDRVSQLATSNSAGFNQNLDQQFVEWLASKQGGINMADKMHGVENMLHNDPIAARDYANEFAKEQAASLANNFASQNGGAGANAAGIGGQASSMLSNSSSEISSDYSTARQGIGAEATMNNLSFMNNIDNSARTSVDSQLSNQQQLINTERTQIDNNGNLTASTVHNREESGIKGNTEIALERTNIKKDNMN